MKFTNIISNSEPEKFVSCRVGLELLQYEENLAKILNDHRIYGLGKHSGPDYDPDAKGNFILVPVAPPSSDFYDKYDNINPSDRLLPDLVLPKYKWETEVAISIGQESFYSDNDLKSRARLDRLLRHALYLPAPVIVIDMPPTKEAQKIVADVINERLKSNHSQRLVLIRVFMTPSTRDTSSFSPPKRSNCIKVDGETTSPAKEDNEEIAMDAADGSSTESGYSQVSSQNSSNGHNFQLGGWESWNNFNSYLVPDHRIGICLVIDNDIESDESAGRWRGEPIRMVVMGLDRFSSTKGFKNTMRPSGSIKEFIKMIAISNSMMTSLVVQSKTYCDAQEQLECLSLLCDYIEIENPDGLRAWDDVILDPLQPLSTNLDSNTYSVFEQDKAKYSKYHEAMLEALGSLMMRPESKERTNFTLMVLGAGRGPLVDAMISAIHKLRLKGKHFKIYALDKNHSSIVSLRYKKVNEWDNYLPDIETTIVEDDMRTWMPEEKADIIATELLGSFSDNELSPECIDGTWRFSTPKTISIPQSYSSYLAPICSFRMRQELHKASLVACSQDNFDKIRVVRLRNYYLISTPKKLFTYEHLNLGFPPRERANERTQNLKFHTEVETTCHGFAGYFTAQLFGRVHISTNPMMKTPAMESWFPAYVPIEEPIVMPADSSIEVRFCRKEDNERVWYEWMILSPKPSRIHCKDGVAASMSKLI
jgi:protein arginine N-methyltransferase 5